MSHRTEALSALKSAAALTIGLLPLASHAELIVRDVYKGLKADNGYQTIDLNGDGSIDFYIGSFSNPSNSNGLVSYVDKNTSNVSTSGIVLGYARLQRFEKGDTVGASTFGTGWSGGFTHVSDLNTDFSIWNLGDTAYAGVRLSLNDGIHYGWIELTRGSLTIGQVGFQTTAGEGALIPLPTTNPPQQNVPEPGSLALLAAGALGAAATRRRARRHAALAA